jgi:hypothetical protein
MVVITLRLEKRSGKIIVLDVGKISGMGRRIVKQMDPGMGSRRRRRRSSNNVQDPPATRRLRTYR